MWWYQCHNQVLVSVKSKQDGESEIRGRKSGYLSISFLALFPLLCTEWVALSQQF
jgi:hypothetical protein